jgi:glutathionyl-hydroquinone reductase
MIVRRLLGLESALSMGICGPEHDWRSWTFDLDPGEVDPVLGIGFLREAYDQAYGKLFARLDWLSERLATRRYLVGDTITEADIRRNAASSAAARGTGDGRRRQLGRASRQGSARARFLAGAGGGRG